jgi:uncharacterized protein (TIGR02118 family)
MIKVTVLYPKTPGSRFDHDYYLNVHMPMSIRLIGHAMTAISVDRGTGGAPWPDAAFHAICTFTCASREAYEQAFFPHMTELQGDILRFTDVQAIIQLSDVVLDWKPAA